MISFDPYPEVASSPHFLGEGCPHRFFSMPEKFENFLGQSTQLGQIRPRSRIVRGLCGDWRALTHLRATDHTRSSRDLLRKQAMCPLPKWLCAFFGLPLSSWFKAVSQRDTRHPFFFLPFCPAAGAPDDSPRGGAGPVERTQKLPPPPGDASRSTDEFARFGLRRANLFFWGAWAKSGPDPFSGSCFRRLRGFTRTPGRSLE